MPEVAHRNPWLLLSCRHWASRHEYDGIKGLVRIFAIFESFDTCLSERTNQTPGLTSGNIAEAALIDGIAMNAPIISEIFKQVSKKHVNNLKQIPVKEKKALLEEKRACRDECVGKIGYRVGERTGFLGVDREDSEGEVFSMRDEVLKFLGSKEATEVVYRVILVLESPHVNEYQGTPGAREGGNGPKNKGELGWRVAWT